jgi:myo-inositol-1(or 4)-monophosphatase
MAATDAHELIETALRAADAAARELMIRADRPSTGIDTKSTATDMVSDADRAAEDAIHAVLDSERPDDGRIAEEGGRRTGTSEIDWVIDPLDGTTNYLWGIPHWAVSIAACDDAGPLAAVVMHPPTSETFIALRGGGSWLGATRLHMPAPPPAEHALVGTGFNYSAEERVHQADALVSALPRVRDIRRFGAAALDICWVAAGRLDAFIERGVQEWDWMAGRLIVTEAGGAIRILGATPTRPAGIAVARPELLESVLGLFGEPPGSDG